MEQPLEPTMLLGLSLIEASGLLARLGLHPVIIKSAPGRSRQFDTLPPDETWRVGRSRLVTGGMELVITPALPLPQGEWIVATEETR
jgi:hypothetical protein